MTTHHSAAPTLGAHTNPKANPEVGQPNELTNPQALMRLMTWLSPAFPIGAFAYSSGLESAYQDDLITNSQELQAWLEDLLRQGPAWNDAVLCAAAWRGETPFDELCALGAALASGKERWLETTAQGDAFLKAAKPWLCDNGLAPLASPSLRNTPLPVAVGALAKMAGPDQTGPIPLLWTLSAYLHAFASNQVQAALRLGRLGQDAGVGILAALEGTIQTVADKAALSNLDDLGAASLAPDLLSIRHETLEPRIFRS